MIHLTYGIMSEMKQILVYGVAGLSCAVFYLYIKSRTKSSCPKDQDQLKDKPQESEEKVARRRALREVEKRAQKEVDSRKPPEKWNTVLFFPDPRGSDHPLSSTSQLLWFFSQARISIHLCIYLLSYYPLEKIILEKYDQGLNIRVITDRDTIAEHNNNARRFKQQGINVLTKRLEGLMHNKFAIIDNDAVIMGSLNWTKQGITTNKENVIATTDRRIVSKYVNEFSRMWKEYLEAERKENEDGLDISP